MARSPDKAWIVRLPNRAYLGFRRQKWFAVDRKDAFLFTARSRAVEIASSLGRGAAVLRAV